MRVLQNQSNEALMRIRCYSLWCGLPIVFLFMQHLAHKLRDAEIQLAQTSTSLTDCKVKI